MFIDIIKMVIQMKRILTLIVCILMIGGVYYKYDSIVNYASSFLKTTPKVVIREKNNYYKNHSYEFVQLTEDFVPYNYQDLLNIFYTSINSGYELFTFYCPNEYEDCINDVAKISSAANVDILTTIGNYVSPFNNFASLKVVYDTTGQVTLKIKHLYSEEDIQKINDKIDQIWNEIVKDDMETEDIIYVFHDYIINNTKYDENYENELNMYTKNHTDAEGKIVNELPISERTSYDSSRALGPLYQGHAICSGYTDLMAIILDRLHLNNYKVASETHVWNVVYINDKWLHLDLTWDDPVSEKHDVDTLLHKFYLIDTESLEEFDIADHTFNKSIYLEVK